MFRLISFVGQDDTDILAHFLDHYRKLGVGEFHIFVHGEWSPSDLTQLQAGDVTIAGVVLAPFNAVMKSAALEAYARSLDGDWLIVVDADEFLEPPYDTLSETTEALDRIGIDELPAPLLQRAAADGRLPTLSANVSLDEAFPFYDLRLAERMDLHRPIWKSKYPLVRLGPHLRLSRGHHLPSSGRASAHLPVRGVLHHFKWRDRLLRSVRRIRGDGSNQPEQDSYARWLNDNGERLPTTGLRPYSRAALFAEGHLMRPKDDELALLSALQRVHRDPWTDSQDATDAVRMLQSMPPAAGQEDSRAPPFLDRRGLAGRPGRIALVTPDFLGMRRTGGIGTAMTALAERLAQAGHEVHVLLSPFGNFTPLSSHWLGYWEARGVHIRQFRRVVARGRMASMQEMSLVLCEALASDGDWDVIHFPDHLGMGAAALCCHAAGLAFQATQIVVTMHGPVAWSRRGNMSPWNETEAEYNDLERISSELAEVLVSPSAYMLRWASRQFPGRAPHLVIPNSLSGESRRFGRMPMRRRRVDQIVFFGRIELRKGIDRFLAAIDLVLAGGLNDFEVVFLGSLGPSFPESALARGAAHWTCRTRFVADYTTHDAIDLLRNDNCLAVMPSRVDNSPYTIYECLENGIPFIASDVGGISELMREEDRARVLIGGDDVAEYAARIRDALLNGAVPAAPSFDPMTADLDLLSLHGNLVEAARLSRSGTREPSSRKVSVILYGLGQPDASLAPVLRRWLHDGVEVFWDRDPLGGIPEAARRASALNQLAKSTAGSAILFCHTSAAPRLESLAAMTAALAATRADAVVCGYDAMSSDGEPDLVPVFGASPELSAIRNDYGARLFVVDKAAFVSNGGFSLDPSVGDILEWEFLNRLKAAGRRIAAVPSDLALATRPSVVLTEHQRGLLVEPWTESAPEALRGFMRMAVNPQNGAHATGLVGRKAVAEVAAESRPPSRDGRPAPILAGRAEEALDTGWSEANEAGRQRIGLDGRLIEASQTYVVETADEADGCDFVVADNVADDARCDAIAAAFRRAEESGAGNSGSPAGKDNFFRFEELVAVDPGAALPVVEALRRAAAITSGFYELGAPLYPSGVKLTKTGTGSFRPPRRPIGLPRADGRSAELDFAGLVHLGDADGGETYFTALDIAVTVRRGRYVGSTTLPCHERAVLGIGSGSLLSLSFSLRASPEGMGRTLRRLY